MMAMCLTSEEAKSAVYAKIKELNRPTNIFDLYAEMAGDMQTRYPTFEYRHVRDALQSLIKEGKIEQQRGPTTRRSTRMFTLTKPVPRQKNDELDKSEKIIIQNCFRKKRKELFIFLHELNSEGAP